MKIKSDNNKINLQNQRMKVNIESLFVTQNNSVLCVGQECEYLLFSDLKCDKKLGVWEIYAKRERQIQDTFSVSCLLALFNGHSYF